MNLLPEKVLDSKVSVFGYLCLCLNVLFFSAVASGPWRQVHGGASAARLSRCPHQNRAVHSQRRPNLESRVLRPRGQDARPLITSGAEVP